MRQCPTDRPCPDREALQAELDRCRDELEQERSLVGSVHGALEGAGPAHTLSSPAAEVAALVEEVRWLRAELARRDAPPPVQTRDLKG